MLLGLPEFEWLSPRTLEEACALLADAGDDTVALAGGTDLFVKMKHRTLVPRRLINLKAIPGLEGIRRDADGGIRIGALTTAEAIGASALIADTLPALGEAARLLGTLQVRNAATLGGNLANASPAAEFAPPLLALDASVRCVGPGGERRVPIDEFFTAPGKTILRKGELVAEVRVPRQPANAQAAYLKHSLRRMDIATASAAVFLCIDGDVCEDARIALGAVGPMPFRARNAEAVLRGQRLDGGAAQRQTLGRAASIASEESFPRDDLRAYASYRRRLVDMLVGKALDRLSRQAAYLGKAEA
jgi:CO/xanthine dehydrogenase FAD-binding subunit